MSLRERLERKQQSMTTPIPYSYYQHAKHQGKIVKLEYDTYDYSRRKQSIRKYAYVYLPYGYDIDNSDKKYDIFYIMHGWTMTAEDFFSFGNPRMKNLLDHMIEDEMIKPTIVVTPTFDPYNQPNDFSKSVRELKVFHKELVNELIPAVESTVRTFARTTDESGLKKSREHRAFGGFSLGAVTTWFTFVHNLDYFKYYLPMSGDCWILQVYGGMYQPKETAQYLRNLVHNSEYNDKDFYIYGAIGTRDVILRQMDPQMHEMMKLTDTFNEGNVCYQLKSGGVHNLEAVMEYVYNGLPHFFC
ncbi:carbohydrate-binding family 9 [Clostridium sp. DL-VIII]|uniref:alpha/beta hydrolase n=1 Tax=Clostridium sp. DL-VIII TaxID=641107 RepID=UPI00023B002A|nr:alpha/beta hydrolase-fold protein [Clostridium sp. DL-VIII]EHI99146.1 carbohydrate-binding family 9 [Clostridium sp. DL-VIII]